MIDTEKPDTWKNLKKYELDDRKLWIKNKIPFILRTLERIISTSSFNHDHEAPWDVIGFICLNDGLYKEAEHLYDDMLKKAKDKNILSQIAYFRGISKFLQGRFKDAYEDFKLARHTEHANRDFNGRSLKALAYMEETIFPMLEMVSKSKEKLRHDLNISRFIEKAIGPYVLKTLHKWNSCSPLFSSNISQGGGYLLTTKNQVGAVKSIAIDPGYNFVDIFKDSDLSIVDLDAIIVTHDHDDHTESIESILSLLAKYNDNVHHTKVKSLDIFGSAGVMLKYQGLFNALDPYGNKEINFKLLVPGSTIDHVGQTSLLEKYGCIFHVKQAFHKELWTGEESSVGIVIETNIFDKNKNRIKIGITGDSRYEAGIGNQFKGCQILLFNIGSLEKEEGKYLSQHLGLIGCVNLLKEAKPQIAILTEFGEEFRGKRATVASVIEEWALPLDTYADDEMLRVIPADIHLELRISDLNIKETSSNIFLPHNMVEVDESESEEIIYKMREKKI